MGFKTAAGRIDDTIDYIRDAAVLDAGMRADVRAFAKAFIGKAARATSTYSVTTSKPSVGADRFSAEMSMVGLATAGNEDQRAMRRSMFLLWSAMGDTQAAAHAKLIGVANVATAFEDTMLKALCVADQAAGRVRGPELMYKRLRHGPIAFLQRYRTFIAGTTKVDNGLTNLIDFSFYFDPMRDRFVFESQPPVFNPLNGAFSVNVTSVPAYPWGTVPGRTANADAGSFATVRGTQFAGKCMVTTQLTGCTFCMQEAGSLFGAHLKPGGTVDGTRLAQQLAGDEAPGVVGGAFANAPATANPFRVFGRAHSTFPLGAGGYDARCQGGGNYATVLGLQRAGTWHVYAQELVIGGSGLPDIVNVREIW